MGAVWPLLVIGASGILAPLVREMAGSGTPVLAVGRRSEALAELTAEPALAGRIQTLALDAGDPTAPARLSAHGPFANAVLYGPATDADTRRALLDGVEGPAVLVLTSAAADPRRVGEDLEVAFARLVEAVRPRPADRVLVLGWVRTSRRWHTPEEVSRAAAHSLSRAGDATLGALRPWSERPR